MSGSDDSRVIQVLLTSTSLLTPSNAHQRSHRRRPAVFRDSVYYAVTEPLIYSLIIPFALLDVWATLYQTLAFGVYRIPRVPRARYVVIDRQRLPYPDGARLSPS